MQNMRKRIIIISNVVVVVLALSYLGLVFVKTGFIEEQLKELVKKESNGKYALEINNTDINFLRLDITMRGVTLTNKADKSSSLYDVRFPSIELNLGSLANLLNRQVKIQQFTIKNPTLRIRKKDKSISKERQDNISQRLAQITGQIENVLEHFVVSEFVLEEGDFKITKQDSTLMELGLIDFLIVGFNKKQRLKTQEFLMSLGQQTVMVGNRRLSFRGVEFDGKTSSLMLKEIKLQFKLDQRSELGVEAESFTIREIDFNELIENGYYLARSIELRKPQVKGHLYESEQKKNDSSSVTVKILSALPFINIKEVLISQPSFDLTLEDLDGEKTKMAFKDGRVEIDELIFLQKDTFPSYTNLAFRFSHLAYGSKMIEGKAKHVSFNDRLQIDSLILNYQKSGTRLRTKLPLLRSSRIDPVKVLNTRYFEVDSFLLKNPQVNGVWSQSRSSSDGKGAKGISSVASLNHLNIENLNVRLDTKFGVISALTADVQVKDVYNTKTPALDLFAASRAYWRKGQNTGSGKNIRIQGQNLKVESAIARLSDFSFDLMDMSARKKSNWLKTDKWHFNSVTMKKVDFHSASDFETSEKKDNSAIPFMADTLWLGEVLFDHKTRKQAIRFAANNSWFMDLNLQRKDRPVAEVRSELKDVVFKNDTFNTSLKKLEIATKGTSKFNSLFVHSLNDSLTVKANQGLLLTDQLRMNELSFPILSFQDIKVDWSKNTGKLSADMDSLAIYDLTPQAKKQKTDTGKFKIDHLLGSIKCWNAQVKYRKGNLLVEGRDISTAISGDLKRVDLRTDRLSADLDKLVIDVKSIEADDHSLTVEALAIEDKLIVADSGLVNTANRLKNAKIVTLTKEFSLTQINWTQLIDKNRLYGKHALIDGLSIESTKDKRLEDLRPIETKPIFHHLFHKIPFEFAIDSFTIRHGYIEVNEYSKTTDLKGTFKLENVEGHGTHLGNGPDYNEQFNISARIGLGKSGIIDLDYYAQADSSFQMDINATGVSYEAINPFVLPTNSVEMRGGYLTNLSISTNANYEKINGTINLAYEGLKLDIHKKGSPNEKNLVSEVKTFIAGKILFKKNFKERYQDFDLEYNTDKSAFGNWVDLTLKGSMNCVLNGKKVTF